MSEVNIAGLDKAELLAALYNRSGPVGMGYLRAKKGDMTVEEAREMLTRGDDHQRDFNCRRPDERLYFDYLHGRPLKIHLGGDVLRTHLYNRDNGAGMAETIVEELRLKLEKTNG